MLGRRRHPIGPSQVVSCGLYRAVPSIGHRRALDAELKGDNEVEGCLGEWLATNFYC